MGFERQRHLPVRRQPRTHVPAPGNRRRLLERRFTARDHDLVGPGLRSQEIEHDLAASLLPDDDVAVGWAGGVAHHSRTSLVRIDAHPIIVTGARRGYWLFVEDLRKRIRSATGSSDRPRPSPATLPDVLRLRFSAVPEGSDE
jgi:hypothetical protein